MFIGSAIILQSNRIAAFAVYFLVREASMVHIV